MQRHLGQLGHAGRNGIGRQTPAAGRADELSHGLIVEDAVLHGETGVGSAHLDAGKGLAAIESAAPHFLQAVGQGDAGEAGVVALPALLNANAPSLVTPSQTCTA